MNYPTLTDLIGLHDSVIAVSGGLQGVRDTGILESVLSHIQNDAYYTMHTIPTSLPNLHIWCMQSTNPMPLMTAISAHPLWLAYISCC